jgi:hypothetical protein
MTRQKSDPTPIEAFLSPLARHARRHPEIEGLVFWAGAEGWGAAPSEMLEAEEIVFYAEGLLLDGFRMQWSLVAAADAPTEPDHIRLEFWQDETAPPALAAGWTVLESAAWTGM